MVGTRGEQNRLDALFEILADERCRTLLYVFTESTDEEFGLDDLVDDVRKRESDQRHAAEPKRRLRIDLHHRLLPKLADADIVDYDRETNVVRYRTDDRSSATAVSILASTVESRESSAH